MIWIRVRDKLPPNFLEVLTIDAQGSYTVCLRNGANEWRYRGCYDDCCECCAGNVTHWAELPEPPK